MTCSATLLRVLDELGLEPAVLLVGRAAPAVCRRSAATRPGRRAAGPSARARRRRPRRRPGGGRTCTGSGSPGAARGRRRTGRQPSSRSKRCESTIWKASPARMYSLATSTAWRYCSALVPRRTAPSGSVRSGRGRLHERFADRAARGRAAARRGAARLPSRPASSNDVVGDHRPSVSSSDVVDERDALAPVVEGGELADDRDHRVGEGRGRRAAAPPRRSISRTTS